jgi:hypothetical protein
VVGSQTTKLTPGPSFGHNLCFRCPNWSCKCISNIYVPTTFQWYKERFNPMSFDPCNLPLKIWESIWDSNSQNGSSLGSVRVHSLIVFCTPRSMRCDSRASVLARTLVNPCLGREPKARVATIWLLLLTHTFVLKKHYRGLEMAQTFASYKCWMKWKPQVASTCLYILIIMVAW